MLPRWLTGGRRFTPLHCNRWTSPVIWPPTPSRSFSSPEKPAEVLPPRWRCWWKSCAGQRARRCPSACPSARQRSTGEEKQTGLIGSWTLEMAKNTSVPSSPCPPGGSWPSCRSANPTSVPGCGRWSFPGYPAISACDPTPQSENGINTVPHDTGSLGHPTGTTSCSIKRHNLYLVRVDFAVKLLPEEPVLVQARVNEGCR